MSEFIMDAATGQPIGLPVKSGAAMLLDDTSLNGSHIYIVPFDTTKHSVDLFEADDAHKHLQACLYLPFGPFSNLNDQIKSQQDIMSRADHKLYALLDPISGKAVGHAAYLRIDAANRSIEVGNILFTEKLQRSISATEAMYLMAKHAFDTLGYRRYEWKCNNLNAPSKRAAERFGFTFEGIFRQAQIVKGHNRDTAWYSMLDTEWPVHKNAFESWLDSGNFDSKGQQKHNLQHFKRRSK